VARPRMTFTLDSDVFEMLKFQVHPKDRTRVVNAAIRQYLATQHPRKPPEDDDPSPDEDKRTREERRRIELAHKIFTEHRVIGIMH